MKTLSIRQPWAWLIVRPDVTDPAARAALVAAGQQKPVENRDWKTSVRGRIQLHAGLTLTFRDYTDLALYFLMDHRDRITLPPYAELQRGGIVGQADLVDCVQHHDSPFFMGPWGLVLENVAPVPFTPFKGSLGFFDAPEVRAC